MAIGGPPLETAMEKSWSELLNEFVVERFNEEDSVLTIAVMPMIAVATKSISNAGWPFH